MLLSAYRLAFYFKRPVSELNMSWREFLQWQAYLAIEPPEQAENYRTAALLAQITNMAGRSLPDKKRVTPDDFMKKPRKRQSEQDQKDFFRALGGK